MESLRVLMIEDSEDDALLIIRNLKKGGYKPVYERVETAAAMKKALKEKQWDIILCDYKMPKFSGPSAIAVLKETSIDIPTIIVSGTVGEETAAECMRLGAQDYIMKDKLSRLCLAIDRELKEAKIRNKEKQEEKALRENEDRFRRISSLTSDIAYSCRTNEDGRFSIDWIIGATERISGYSIEEIKAQSCWRFLVLEEDIALFEKNVIGLEPGSHGFCEIRIRHKNGSIVWIASNAECFMATETPEQFVLHGALVDITQRKKVEEELRKSEEKYRLIFDFSPMGLISFDEKGVILACNDNFVKIIGSSREKLIGLNMLNLPDKKMVSAIHKALNGSHGYYEGDYSSTTAKKITSVRCLFEPMDIGGKRIPGGVGIIEDITESKKAEEKLRESEERFRSMIQSLSDIIFILDGNGLLTYESPSATRILGYQPGHFIGKSPFTHIHPDDLDQVMKDLDEVFLSVNPGIPTEFRFQKADDTWIYLEALGNNQFENPCIQGIVLTVRDITARKRAEEKLQQTLENLKNAVGTTIHVLASAVEARDPYTSGHQLRSADLARAIATEMGLPKDKIDGIRMAGSIHDIGKLSIPAEILSKPTKLTSIEFSLIKVHSQSGYEMLKDVESPWPLAEIIYQHHERMNGSGYPRNLKGNEILMESRILAVADVVEAMASYRPYRPALGIEAALEEIEKNKGILYDNTAADTCLKLFREKGYQLT